MLEIISGNFAAGETKEFAINGERFEILDAQYPVDVLLMDKHGSQLSVMRAAEASFFAQPKEGFQTIQIKSASPQTVRFFIGSGDAGTRRISSSVQVIDGNAARSKAGAGYAWRLTCYGDANNRAASQLWNPAGSGVRLIVDNFNASLTVASSVVYGFFGTALATSTPDRLRNVLGAGAAAGKAQCRLELFPTTNNTLDYLGASYMPANGQVSIDFKRPIVVMPGQGLILMSDNANNAMTGTAQFYEEAI